MYVQFSICIIYLLSNLLSLHTTSHPISLENICISLYMSCLSLFLTNKGVNPESATPLTFILGHNWSCGQLTMLFQLASTLPVPNLLIFLVQNNKSSFGFNLGSRQHNFSYYHSPKKYNGFLLAEKVNINHKNKYDQISFPKKSNAHFQRYSNRDWLSFVNKQYFNVLKELAKR